MDSIFLMDVNLQWKKGDDEELVSTSAQSVDELKSTNQQADDVKVAEEKEQESEPIEYDFDFDVKPERKHAGRRGGRRFGRCNGGRGNEVKLCIGSQILGLSSSESDTDDEYMGYYCSQLQLDVPSDKRFADYPAYLAAHRQRKQARRDGYDEKEKARRRLAKDKIKEKKASIRAMIDSGTPCTYQELFDDFFARVWDEKVAAAVLLANAAVDGPLFANVLAEERKRDKPFGNRFLLNEENVFEKNAWDNVEWGEDQKQEAIAKVDNNSKVLVDETKKICLEENAAGSWDKFYSIHQNKFFRDRRWLFAEFPELLGPFGHGVSSEECISGVMKRRKNESFPGQNSKFRILEVGCGNGSTVFPVLLDSNHPDTYVYCCDFAKSAVDVVLTSPKLDSTRCTPFVWDITQEDCELPFPSESLDVITVIFVLSAISPEKFANVARNIYKYLKPGGMLLFRDYGLYDLVQLRQPTGRCISENFYFRADGTMVYFFTEDEVENLFKSHGLEKVSLFVDRRLQVNRLRELKMYRIWIQGKFRKPDINSP